LAEYLIGTSGWHYADWRGKLYPEKMPPAQWLGYYARHFNTVELNNSFYRLPTDAAFDKWYGDTPAGFTFAVKASRYITHIKRLRDTGEPVQKFMERARRLREKLGPVLYQLHPAMPRDDARLEAFLAALPPETEHAIEFRHESWFAPEVAGLLRRYGVAECAFDMPGMRSPLEATAPFAYLRFHGGEAKYSSEYTDNEMRDWAEKLKALGKEVAQVYIYFNNDVQGFALKNARTLREYLGA